jgi:hypothetical protein
MRWMTVDDAESTGAAHYVVNGAVNGASGSLPGPAARAAASATVRWP